MDEEPLLDARARRAIPLIAAALTVIVVAGLIYVRANAPPPSRVLVGTPPVPQLAASYWPSYDFTTPSLGWAGIVRQAGVPTIWVFRTTDGARHWQRQLTATLSVGAPPSIHFFDQQHGIFYAGRLYRTVDGGGTWDVISLPDGTPDFVFASPTRGWALTPTANLYSTGDGGLTWRMLNTTMPSLAPMNAKGGSTTFDFRANGEGWSGSAGPTPSVYSSADGGAGWHAVTVPVPAAAFPFPTPPPGKPYVQERPNYTSGVEVLPGDGVIAVVVDNFGNTLVLTSFDRGATWRAVHWPPGPIEFGDISFVDSMHWWASRWGTLFKTSDAGQTWTEVHVVAAAIYGDWVFGPAQVIDSRHAWLKMTAGQVGNGSTGLAMTSDGGVHWTAVNVPQPV